ncbi:Asp-tRNA(Asn)/Glu-tRNA(Gln) amidotransferase subunit GatA [Enhygromyxa salina]|uniref:Glutamyl-tRNA(Gln) amidotransferase subunit A n=1 Tax=Enhygromyxa salina TaxID=215803 RepID=A0A2S9YX16_9BACT|nr:Asp-tRNA(Asn)/Glu-tRNA(Gln) amidotransferase subunit GatA [Enhygromyxa salina]PRQ09630.1 Glutamyl-tRNA(Gln) amidotransferase subunit A [Enhygromyxa salina]
MSDFDDILARSARALASGIRRGELSAVDVTQAHLEQIQATEPALHAYRCVTSELALEQAAAVDRARAAGAQLGPLAGVPVALKDIFVTEGVATTCGSAILSGWVPPYQGTHAQRLADAGAVLLGKLAMDEFGMGSASENTPFEPVHNPWAVGHVPGGSSGGTAAAVAARSCALGLGTDTGGSIRQPASLCNLVGLKPTYGRVSRHGMIAFASSLDQAGPMTREVGDAALALGVLAGVDPSDATSLDAPVPDYLAAVDAGALGQLAGTTIGVHRRALELDGLDAEVRARFEASLAVLADAGARVVDIELPHFEHAVATYYVLCTAEASSNLARYDGVRYGLRRARPSLRETYEATRHDGFGVEVKRRILLGTFVLRAESYADYYGRAMQVRSLIAQDYAAAFTRCDMIASPTSPVPSWRIGAKVDDPLALYLLDVFTIGANLAGLPAISIPAGFTTSSPRLPIGLQLIGPHLAEPALLRVAAAHEAATAWHLERPPATGAAS